MDSDGQVREMPPVCDVDLLEYKNNIYFKVLQEKGVNKPGLLKKMTKYTLAIVAALFEVFLFQKKLNNGSNYYRSSLGHSKVIRIFSHRRSFYSCLLNKRRQTISPMCSLIEIKLTINYRLSIKIFADAVSSFLYFYRSLWDLSLQID